MIEPNRKIGIVYCGKSEKYVEAFENIIMEKKSEGYCIETIVVNSKIIDEERTIDNRVFNNLDKCDYGIVFLTKDLTIEGAGFVSKPNVLVELGYLKGRLEKNCVWCITDFPHSDIEDKKYIFPSDFAAEVPEEIDPNNYRFDLKRVAEKFINTHKIDRLDHFDANNVVGSLILNPYYKTDFGRLFSKDKLIQINKYSLKCQQKEILEMWLEEKNRLDEAAQVIYLFERIVFLSFFPQKVISGKLTELLSIHISEENEYLYSCRRILKSINEYEEYKRDAKKYRRESFYLDKARKMEQELRLFSRVKLAPVIECVTRDYIGLSYLNSFLIWKRMINENRNEDGQKHILELAQNNFERVIQLSERSFDDKVEVIQAFAKYNMARVLRGLQKDADSEYNSAISKRRLLSETSDLPEIFRLNFTLERILAEIGYYNYMKESGAVAAEDYNDRILALARELRIIRETPAADSSLFKVLEEELSRSV